MKRKVVLTGIKPTGSVHIGRYLGAIKPALALVDAHPDFEFRYFIADYHALTTARDPEEFRLLCYQVAASWLAIGLDPKRCLFYRQSDLPEVFELTWLLACVTPKGLMNRAHAYKAAVAENQDKGVEDTDAGVNMGLYNYPILMAADILLFEADLVPVGADQLQHLEMTRDIASSFNRIFGEVLTVPEAIASTATGAVPGLDGRKMSASYDNTIPLFVDSKGLRDLVFRIKTDSTPAHAPKDPATSAIFLIYKEFASQAEAEALCQRYRQGISWTEAKGELFRLLDCALDRSRRRYKELMADMSQLDALLAEGAAKARPLAQHLMRRVRRAVGRRGATGH